LMFPTCIFSKYFHIFTEWVTSLYPNRQLLVLKIKKHKKIIISIYSELEWNRVPYCRQWRIFSRN
jgi:hypothetical protein